MLLAVWFASPRQCKTQHRQRSSVFSFSALSVFSDSTEQTAELNVVKEHATEGRVSGNVHWQRACASARQKREAAISSKQKGPLVIHNRCDTVHRQSHVSYPVRSSSAPHLRRRKTLPVEMVFSKWPQGYKWPTRRHGSGLCHQMSRLRSNVHSWDEQNDKREGGRTSSACVTWAGWSLCDGGPYHCGRPPAWQEECGGDRQGERDGT